MTVTEGSARPSSFSSSSAFARQRHQVVRALRAGIQRGAVRKTGAKPGMKAEVAEDPKMVLGDAFQRIADEAHVSFEEIVGAAEIVEYLARPGVRRQRIDREVAARRVLLPVGGERDSCPATVGRYVAA